MDFKAPTHSKLKPPVIAPPTIKISSGVEFGTQTEILEKKDREIQVSKLVLEESVQTEMGRFLQEQTVQTDAKEVSDHSTQAEKIIGVDKETQAGERHMREFSISSNGSEDIFTSPAKPALVTAAAATLSAASTDSEEPPWTANKTPKEIFFYYVCFLFCFCPIFCERTVCEPPFKIDCGKC